MLTSITIRATHRRRRARRGQLLVEALIALTVLLVCSAMIAQTTLTVIRHSDAWHWRTAAIDSLDHRVSRHWLSHCLHAAPDSGRIDVGEGRAVAVRAWQHPTLDSAGILLKAQWPGLPFEGVVIHDLFASSGHWCGA